MRKLSMIGLVVLVGLAGCGDSDGGGSGAGTSGGAGTAGGTSGGGTSGGGTGGTGGTSGAGTSGSVAGTSGSTAGTSGAAACDPTMAMMGSGNAACDTCVNDMCGADIASCYGAGWESGDVSGPCAGFLECICNCPSGDVACPVGCFTNASPDCINCQTTLGLCSANSCQTECGGTSGM